MTFQVVMEYTCPGIDGTCDDVRQLFETLLKYDIDEGLMRVVTVTKEVNNE